MSNVFISHIEEEASLAKALKTLLESRTAGYWKVFVRTDPADIAPGDNVLARIDAALREHEVLIALCSRNSMERFWIGHETGCGVGRCRPIIPVCHSGATPDALPPFLSRYQALVYEAPDFAQRLFEALHRHIPLKVFPDVFDATVSAAAVDGTPHTSGAAQIVQRPATRIAPEVKTPDCEEILRQLADPYPEGVSLRVLAGSLGLPSVRVQYYFNALERSELACAVPSPPGDVMYALTRAGSDYVVAQGLV